MQWKNKYCSNLFNGQHTHLAIPIHQLR